jgi:ArsR family transcriptional regulator
MNRKRQSKDVCQIFCFNKAKISKVKKALLSMEGLNVLAEIFNVISDGTRIKILLALKEEELCVCDISSVLGLSVSAVSHQLRLLRNLGLVKYRNEGKLVFYSLADQCVIKLIEEGIRHTKERL